jgi:hypothetical protein
VKEGVVGVRLSVEGEDSIGGLEELSDWLGREPDLRRMITPVFAEPACGELGTLTDALIMAVGSGGALSALAASLKTFLALPRRSDLRIVLSAPDGRRVEIDAKRVADVEAVIRALGTVE